MKKAKCPICRKIIEPGETGDSRKPQWLPFCSERCKLIDLGKWLDSSYTIPAAGDQTEENSDDAGSKDGQEDI